MDEESASKAFHEFKWHVNDEALPKRVRQSRGPVHSSKKASWQHSMENKMPVNNSPVTQHSAFLEWNIYDTALQQGSAKRRQKHRQLGHQRVDQQFIFIEEAVSVTESKKSPKSVSAQQQLIRAATRSPISTTTTSSAQSPPLSATSTTSSTSKTPSPPVLYDTLPETAVEERMDNSNIDRIIARFSQLDNSLVSIPKDQLRDHLVTVFESVGVDDKTLSDFNKQLSSTLSAAAADENSPNQLDLQRAWQQVPLRARPTPSQVAELLLDTDFTYERLQSEFGYAKYPISTALHDMHGMFLWTNPAHDRQWNVSHGYPIGRAIQDVLNFIGDTDMAKLIDDLLSERPRLLVVETPSALITNEQGQHVPGYLLSRAYRVSKRSTEEPVGYLWQLAWTAGESGLRGTNRITKFV